jgi:hypothetical protein
VSRKFWKPRKRKRVQVVYRPRRRRRPGPWTIFGRRYRWVGPQIDVSRLTESLSPLTQGLREGALRLSAWASQRVEWRRVGRWGITLAVAFVLAALPISHVQSPPQESIDYRFGIAQSVTNLLAAASLQVGWSRIPLFWTQVEPSSGNFSPYYTFFDQKFLTAAAEGEALVGVVQGVPSWAQLDPKDGPQSVPKGLDLPWNDPENTWGQYMYWLARHYAGLINTWVIGDEISIKTGQHRTWDGTIPQYARLIQVAYEAAKAANPAAKILTPAAPYWYAHGAATDALLTALSALPGARAHHDYIDAIDVNLYNTTLFNRMIYGKYQALLRQHHLQFLPIWLTEANAVPRTRHYPAGVSASQQAAMIVQDLSSSWAYVTRVEMYKMQDTLPPARFQWGMYRADGTPRPEVRAYRVLIQELSGSTWLRQSMWRLGRGHHVVLSPVATVTLGAPRRLIQIVWNQTFHPQTVRVPAVAAKATLVSIWGRTRTISPTGGAFVLTLPPATYHHPKSPLPTIGGLPYYIIQRVGLGQDGTPRHKNLGTPDGFPAHPTGRWSHSHPWPRLAPGQVAVAVNPSGDQVVIDDGGTAHWIEDAGAGAAQLNVPVAAAVGPGGDVFVANSGNSDVLVYSPTGRLIRHFGGYGQLLGLSGIAVSRTGRVYVSDAGAQSVVVFSARGHYLGSWGRWGPGPGELDGPDAITVGVRGTVYVADTLNHRVESFSPDGSFLSYVNVKGYPSQLRWDGHSALLVQDGQTGVWTKLRVPFPPPHISASVTAPATSVPYALGLGHSPLP